MKKNTSSSNSTLVARNSMLLIDSNKKQIFTDTSGKRWKKARIALSLTLLVLIVFSFFGIESTIRSTQSFLQLEAGLDQRPTASFPVVLDLNSNDYAHFKEYASNFSELLLRGRVNQKKSRLLNFKQKYIADTPHLYVESINELSPVFLEDRSVWDIHINSLSKYLLEYNYTGLAFQVTDDLDINKLDINKLEQVRSLYRDSLGSDFIFKWILTDPFYGVGVNFVEDVYVILDKNVLASSVSRLKLSNRIPLFHFEYNSSSPFSSSPNSLAFQESLSRGDVCIYQIVGNCNGFTFVDSFSVSEFLRVSGYTGVFGFSNLSNVDSRAWKLEQSFTPYSEEVKIFLTTAIDTWGSGEMYRIARFPQPLTLSIGRTKEGFLRTTVVNLPAQARVVRYGKKKSSVNLSFDDGPHPDYTPAILDFLKEENITATFYVVGANVRKYPDIAKRIVDEGHEIANHTYIHPRTYYLSHSAFAKEVTLTQQVIEETTGIRPLYFRTPFNDTDGYETNYDLKNLSILEDLGLQVSEFEVDSKDWTKPGVDTIVNNVLKKVDTGDYSQILFHDGGGDKTQTIESLPGVIDGLKERNIAFVPLENLNHHHTIKPSRQGLFWTIRNAIKIWNARYLSSFFWGYTKIFAWITFFKLFVTLFLFGLALLKRKKYTTAQPPVSVIVPAYNEEKSILETVRTVLMSDYPLFEVVVINDGSKDSTLDVLESVYKDHPLVTIVDKKNGGKASASNLGILKAQYEHVVCIDADTVILQDTISKLMRNFISPEIAGVSGNIHIGNHGSFLTQTQRAEYIYGQSFDKEIFNITNSIPVVPGALGAWKKSEILAIDGYSNQTLAEDTDLTLRIRKRGKRIVYEREAIAITEAPSSLMDFFKQRIRWQYGTLQCVWKHKNMIFNPRYGYLGLVVLPEIVLSFLFLGMMLAYLYMLILVLFNFTVSVFSVRADIQLLAGGDATRALTFMMASLALYYLSNIMAVMVDNNNRKWEVLWYLPYQMIVYRAFLWFTQCLVVIKAIKGGAQSWNHLQRKGLRLSKLR